MEKINLTKEDAEVTERYLKGEMNPFAMSKEESEAMSRVITEMERCQDAIPNGIEESGDFPLKWFWDKYKEQEGI